MKLLEILKAALTKFSKINLVQYVGIATLIIQSWQGADLISTSVVLMLTGALTLVLKFQASTTEMVATGFSMDWTVYWSGLLGLLIGFLDTFITDNGIMTWIAGDSSKWVVMAYMAITIIFRTGFTNQSLNTKASA